jgi:hypothetical protein
MKKILSPYLYILLLSGCLSLFLNSCQFSESGMVRSTGAINELLIVTDSKAQWEGAFGDSLRTVFAGEMDGLPQPEPLFDIINIAAKDFGDLYQRYHNIFIAEINPEIPTAKLEVRQNVWSDPQRVIRLSAHDMESFLVEFSARKDAILDILIRLERERTLTLSEMSDDLNLSGTITRKFNFSMSMPGGFYIAQDSPDFLWLRHKITKAKQDVELGIMIYARPYQDTAIFNPAQIIAWRNLITREFVPGPSEGSFMKVSQEYIPPVFEVMHDFAGGYAVETRGIWEVENDYMGGAFISYTFVNPKTSQVVTLDGYVYNPNNDKKNFIRHLESIFWGTRLL